MSRDVQILKDGVQVEDATRYIDFVGGDVDPAANNGVTVTLTPSESDAIPQGGPLTEDLILGDFSVTTEADDDASIPLQVTSGGDPEGLIKAIVASGKSGVNFWATHADADPGSDAWIRVDASGAAKLGGGHIGAIDFDTESRIQAQNLTGLIVRPFGTFGQHVAVIIAPGATVIPTDGALNAGELALWFDATNGAAKLMLKGKTANGTVVTGSVTLT